jgi:hypothetical protein
MALRNNLRDSNSRAVRVNPEQTANELRGKNDADSEPPQANGLAAIGKIAASTVTWIM